MEWSKATCPGDKIIGYIITYGCNQQDELAYGDLMTIRSSSSQPSLTLELTELMMQEWECVFTVQGIVLQSGSLRECVTRNSSCAVITASSYMTSMNGNKFYDPLHGNIIPWHRKILHS